MVGRLYGMSRADAKRRGSELLERFDLVDAAGRPAKTYSGGMRRRLDLADALVAKPPVLFLDEPTTGLDPRSRLSLWETIEELVSEGTTVLLTTQYLDEADRLADEIAVIDHGKVIAEGTPDALKDRVGGERLEVRLADASECETAAPALAPMTDEPPVVEGDTVRLHGAPARGRDRRGRAAARRGRRRTSTTSRCGARRSTTCSCRSPATWPRRTARKRRSGDEAPGDRHDGGGRAQPRPAPPRPRPAARLHRAAGHVRAVVRVRLRRRDQHAGLFLRRLPDPGHHRPEHRLRRVRHGARAQRGPAQGPDRPLPLAADGAARRCSPAGRWPTW